MRRREFITLLALKPGGNVTYLNEAEATKIGAGNDAGADRPWELWKRQALARQQR
jgi:hypothetical protein